MKDQIKTTAKQVATIAALFAAALLAGCATKSRSFDAKGMYASESGQLAIGKIHVDAIPEGTDSAVVHYSEDTAWISDTKTHAIDIILTGTNSVDSAEGIVEKICDAFIAVRQDHRDNRQEYRDTRDIRDIRDNATTQPLSNE